MKEKPTTPFPYTKTRLFCPGPTPIPTFIRQRQIAEQPYHRAHSFVELMHRCRMGLQKVLGAKERPLILTSSGTGAMEAAVVNLTTPGDKVFVLVAGKF